MKKDDHLGLIYTTYAQLTLQREPIRKQHDFFMLMTISAATVTHFTMSLETFKTTHSTLNLHTRY